MTRVNMRGVINTTDVSRMMFYVLASLVWTQGTLFVYFKSVMRRLPLFGSISDDIIIPFIIVLLIAISIPYMLKKLRITDVGLYVGILLIYCFSYLLNTDNADFLSENAGLILLNTVPVYFIGSSIQEEKMIDLFYKLSLCSIVCMFIYNNVIGLLEQNEYMSEAYKLLPHICLVIYYTIKKPRALNIALLLIGLITLISYGNRGTVLLVTLFIVACSFFFRTYKHKGIIRFLLIITMALLVVYSNQILLWLAKIVGNMGMSTRAIDLLLEGEFFLSESRNNLKDIMWVGIMEKPIFGYGIGGDRCLIPLYAHDIVYEMWASFGLLFGTIFIIGIVVLICRAIKKSNSEKSKVFIWLLVCCAFIKLFISSTYLNEPLFFLMLGMCLSVIRQNTYNKGEQKE